MNDAQVQVGQAQKIYGDGEARVAVVVERVSQIRVVRE